MDSLDKKILWELIANCRISYRELGKKVNLSASSVKKRIDNLEESGFIDHYNISLNPEIINTRYATLLATTDASVKIASFIDVVMSVDGVYMVLPLIDGNFYVSIEYYLKTDLIDFSKLIHSINGVKHVEVYDVLPKEVTADLPDTPEFTGNELLVISRMMEDPRIADHDIATQLGWTTKKVKQVLQKLTEDRKVAWGLRWNPNMGKGIAFNLVITYDSEITNALEITSRLNDMYPISYFSSRNVESRSTVFAVFDVVRVVEMEPIAMAVLDYPGILSCYAITYYNAILGKTLSRIRLEKILEREGLWTSKQK
ncbi:MAG: winged helix-turn-helix transcriptional regulator [Candidatus Thorarchaeota archaeon]